MTSLPIAWWPKQPRMSLNGGRLAGKLLEAAGCPNSRSKTTTYTIAVTWSLQACTMMPSAQTQGVSQWTLRHCWQPILQIQHHYLQLPGLYVPDLWHLCTASRKYSVTALQDAVHGVRLPLLAAAHTAGPWWQRSSSAGCPQACCCSCPPCRSAAPPCLCPG